MKRLVAYLIAWAAVGSSAASERPLTAMAVTTPGCPTRQQLAPSLMPLRNSDGRRPYSKQGRSAGFFGKARRFSWTATTGNIR
jgi:hypothetical protein